MLKRSIVWYLPDICCKRASLFHRLTLFLFPRQETREVWWNVSLMWSVDRKKNRIFPEIQKEKVELRTRDFDQTATGRRTTQTKMRRVWKSKLQPRPAESNHSCSSSASAHMTTASHAHVGSGSAKLQLQVNTREEEQRLQLIVRRCLVSRGRYRTDTSVHASCWRRNSTTARRRKHRAEAEYVPRQEVFPLLSPAQFVVS